MIRLSNAIFFVIIFLMTVSFSYGDEVINLNADEVVLKALSHEPQTKGTLAELLKKNKIVMKGEESVEKLFLRLGINPEKIEIIEGYIIMRWSVKRVRVSPNYELLLQLGLGGDGKELVTDVAVIPHRPDMLRHKLSNQKNWDVVTFE